jgi:hypothetical protein
MKNILMLFFVLLLSAVNGYAQYSFPVEPQSVNSKGEDIVPAMVFPLGALLTGDADKFLDSLKKVSINTVTTFGSGGGQNHVAKVDTLGSVSGANGMLPDFTDYNERRMYFFSGYDPAPPNAKSTLHKSLDYGTKNNRFYDSRVVADGDESSVSALLSDTLSLASGGIDTLSNSAYAGQYVLRHPDFGYAFTDDTNRIQHYFDFIYRFDTTGSSLIDSIWGSFTSTEPLYEIELRIRASKDTNLYGHDATLNYPRWKLYDTILTFPITKTSFRTADTYWDTSQLEHGLRQPRITGFPNNINYERIHIALPQELMRKMFVWGHDNTKWLGSHTGGFRGIEINDPNTVYFDYRVRRVKPIKMYIKGLRIREHGAEQLLTGKLDTMLADRYTKISQSKYYDGNGTLQTGSYYKSLLNLQTENEPYPFRYYIISYLDRFAREKKIKRFTAFSPWESREIRLIWDDILWKPDMTDAAPEHLYRNIEYQADGNQVLPIPRDVLPKTIPSNFRLYSQSIADRTDLDLFEAKHDSSVRTTLRARLQEINQAAFSIGTKPVPFWVMGQAYMGLVYRNPSTGAIDNSHMPQTRDNTTISVPYLVQEIKSILSNPSTTSCDELTAHAFNPSFLYDTTTVGNDRANVTAEQIRLQANMSAAWGAKGFTVSNAGTNGLRDLGFSGVGNDVITDMYDTTKPFMVRRDFYGQDLNVSDSVRYYQVDRIDSAGTNWWFTPLDNLSTDDYTYRESPCNLGNKGRWIPYHDPNTSSLYCISDCASIVGAWMWMPTFYGYKTRFKGVGWAMGDLNRVARKLATLKWTAAVDVAGLDATIPASYQDSLPIKDITTFIQKKRRMTSETDVHYLDSTATDASGDRLVEIGVFRDSNDLSARYIHVVNRRVWPNRFVNDTFTNSSYLGNVAVRSVKFKIKKQIFGADSVISLWSVHDLSTGIENVETIDDTFSVRLQPGEGHLLRIAPGISATLGDMSKNLYNNARHIAAIEEDSLTKYGMVFEKGGRILISYPTETGAPTKRTITAPATTIEGSTTFSHPAISYNPTNDKIGVVYQFNTPVAGQDSMDVRIRYKTASLNTKTTFSSAYDLVVFKAHKSFEATPAIASYQDGTFNFWVSWRDPKKGGVLGIVNTSHALVDTASIFRTSRTTTKFVSLATHKDATDSVFFACEESTKIYSGAASFDGTSNTIVGDLRGSPNLRCISASHDLCFHYNPQIVVDKERKVGVTWDSKDIVFKYPGKAIKYPHYVTTKFRTPTGQWGKFTTIRVFEKPDSLAHIKDTLRAYPTIGIATEMRTLIPPYIWDDSIRVMWNNPVTQLNGVTRVGNGQSETVLWRIYNMKASSLEPAMPYSFTADKVLHPVLYRSPFKKETGFFEAKVTNQDFPIVEVAVNQNPRVGMMLGYGNCSIIGGKLDSAILVKRIGDVDTMVINPNPIAPPKWDDSTVRTNGFPVTNGTDTIWYNRLFQIGHFEVGDTSTAQGGLYGYDDYVKIRILVRKATNHEVLAVLDSSILTQSGYSSTFDADNAPTLNTYIPTFTDSVYISFEGSRKNPANSYEIELDARYNDDPFNYLTDAVNPVYKMAGQTPSVPLTSESHISISVVPNPFKNYTTIGVDAPVGAPLSVIVYDVLGKAVANFYSGINASEHNSFTLDGKMLSEGTYFIRVQVGNEVDTRKIQLMK